MSDEAGFRPLYCVGTNEETEEMREASLKHMSKTVKNRVPSKAKQDVGMIGINISGEGCGIFVGLKGTIEFVITEDEMAVAVYGGFGPYNGVPGYSATVGTTQYSTSNIDKLEGICWDAGGSYSGVLFTGGTNVIFAPGLMGSGQSFGISGGIPGPATHVIPVKTIKLWRTKTPDYPLIIDPT